MSQRDPSSPSQQAPGTNSSDSSQEPIFNLPRVVVVLSVLFIAIHLLRVNFLSDKADLTVLLQFAFWPVRYDPAVASGFDWPGGFASEVWSFVSYAFLHGGTSHIVFNLLWMAVFGSAVARRFGSVRFLLLSALCAAAGASAHLMTNWGQSIPVIGASAAISGQMAAAIRFIFELGGPMGAFRQNSIWAYRVPARPLIETLSNPSALWFVVVWFGINLLFGLWSAPLADEGTSIAWQAHVGGFVAGLALFRLLDPIPRRA